MCMGYRDELENLESKLEKRGDHEAAAIARKLMSFVD